MKNFFKKVGKILAYPVTKPIQLAKQGVEKTMAEAIKGVVRHVITTMGGVLVSSGMISGSDLEMLAGAASVVVGIIWSIVSKRT